jgi:hypothetical protein
MAEIKLDPKTKLPIWPNGVVPEHPRDKNGVPIMAPPVWTPPLEPAPSPMSPPPVMKDDIVKMFIEQLQSIREEIRELKARVDSVPPA